MKANWPSKRDQLLFRKNRRMAGSVYREADPVSYIDEKR